ncbi:hypothetical protein HYQ44_005942 [Verticillium longisporum]|nr:hypothetical protein HYQ44_005942 [Verticillium longisporum]
MAMGANVGALLCCLAALQNSQNSVQTGQQAIQPRPWRTHQLLTGCLVDGELSSFRDTVTFLKRCASRVSEQQGHRAVVGSRMGQSPEAAKKPDLDFAAAAAAAIRCQSWGL